MANPKALQSIVSIPGKLGTLRSYAPTWGRASVTREHGSGEKSFSPLAQAPIQELSLSQTSMQSVGAHHVGMSLHDDTAPSERRHFKRSAFRSPHFAR
jgi:hypothetical protein